MYLQKLLDIIESKSKSEPFICIKDLVKNGLSVERFADDCYRPSRHEITLFLATWCRRIGLTPESYCDWLVEYCVDVLSAISSSSLSQIRHSTKSSIKYIHRSDIPFSCNCHNNIFKAVCSTECPVYEEMNENYLRNLEEEQKKIAEFQKIEERSEPDPESLPVTKRYKQQFEESVVLIKQYLEKGYTKKKIAGLLNEKGYKTITGYDWKPATVSRIAIEKNWVCKRKKRKVKRAVPVQFKLF